MTSTSADAADRITDTGYSYNTLGRTLTVPAAGTTGTGTLTLGYFSNDFVASEAQNGTTVSYTLDPEQERARTQTSSASGITTTNHYSGGSDSPAWAANSDGSWTRNVAGPDGNLAATNDSTGTLTLDLPNMHGDIGATIADSSSVPASSAVLLAYTEFGTPDTAATTTTSTVGGASADYCYEGAHRRSAGDLGGLIVMGQRLYNPTTGRFLQTDPVPGGSANNYDYANQDPINNNDLNGQSFWHHIGHWADEGYRQSIRAVAVVPYAVYYGSYRMNRSRYTPYLFHPLGWLGQIDGIAGDATLDYIKGHTGFHESVWDEHTYGSVNPFHRGSQGHTWLPGLSRGAHGGHHFDFAF